eukprot:COSAG04_NODE_10278_length_790_cov_1.334298_1_plen_96_part_00
MNRLSPDCFFFLALQGALPAQQGPHSRQQTTQMAADAETAGYAAAMNEAIEAAMVQLRAAVVLRAEACLAAAQLPQRAAHRSGATSGHATRYTVN